MSDIVTRRRKLLALANDSDSAESQKAKEIYEKLLKRYGIDEDSVYDRVIDTHHFRLSERGTQAILSAVCRSLGIQVYLIPDARKRRKVVSPPMAALRCTQRQFTVALDLYEWSVAIYVRRRYDSKVALRSFLEGHLSGMYPDPDADRCPKCKSPLFAFDRRAGRFVCPDCGHKGGKGSEIDPAALQAGLDSAKRPVVGRPGDRLALPAPEEEESR